MIYDANVLVAASLTDTLIRTASAGLCTAHWSQDILDEVYRTLRKLGMDESKARRRIAVMAAQAKALHSPTMTTEDVLERLSQHVPTFTKALRSFRAKHAIVPFAGVVAEDVAPKDFTIRRRTRRAPRDIS